MKNVIESHLTEGAVWTFVHSSGKRTEYIYKRETRPATSNPDSKGLPLDAMHELLNPVTGKFAYVTSRWLRDGPIPYTTSATGHNSHWLVGRVVEVVGDDRRLAA